MDPSCPALPQDAACEAARVGGAGLAQPCGRCGVSLREEGEGKRLLEN